MRAVGIAFSLLGVGLILIGLFMDSSAGNARVANLSVMNFKVILATSGEAAFVSGCVCFVGSCLIDAINDLGAANNELMKALRAKKSHAVPSATEIAGSPSAQASFHASTAEVESVDVKSEWKGLRQLSDAEYLRFLLARYPAANDVHLNRGGRKFKTQDEMLQYLDEKDRGYWPEKSIW